MRWRTCSLMSVLLLVLLVSMGCPKQRSFSVTLEPGGNTAVIRTLQEAIQTGPPEHPLGSSHGFQIVRLDDKRMDDFCHEVEVEPGPHTLVVYFFYSLSEKLPPKKNSSTFYGPVTIEIDALAGHIYTIVGDETQHAVVEEPAQK